jgi:arsenate reductase-like glutaredoxin family protein
MAGWNQSFLYGREPVKRDTVNGSQVYSSRGKPKAVLPAGTGRELDSSLSSEQPVASINLPYLAQPPDKKPPVKAPDWKLPEDWKRILPEESQIRQWGAVVKDLLPQMLDPGGVRITQQGNGEAIRQAQWQQQLTHLQTEKKSLEGIEQRFVQSGKLSDWEREQVMTKPQAAREKEVRQLERIIPLVTQQKERLERGQRKLGILLADKPDQTTLQNRLVSMQEVHENRIQKANEAQTLLNQQMLKAVDKNPDELLMRVMVVKEEVRLAYEESAILNELLPDLQGLLKQPLDHETLVKQAQQLSQNRAEGIQKWADKVKELQTKQASQIRLQEQFQSLKERLDHPEYFPYEHWTAEQKAEALAVVQDYTQKGIRRLDKEKADIALSQTQMQTGGLNALRLPQDHPDLEKKWGHHVMVSVSTGQEQSAIFQEHFKSLLERAKTTESLSQAMIETAQKDAKAFSLKYPLGLGAESVYSTPMVSTNQLDLWKKKDDTVKKRVVVYIQGHHHADVQKNWMDADEAKMKAQLSSDYQTGETPVEWVSLKGKNKQEVLQALTLLKSQANLDTEFLVVMNGHGMQVPSENDKLDARMEGSPVGHFQLTQTEDLTENDMKDALQHLSGSRGVLLLFSSCHSGAWLAQNLLRKTQNGDNRYYA